MEKTSQIENCFLFSIIVLLISWLFYTLINTWWFFWRFNGNNDFGIPLFGSHWRELFDIESWHDTLTRIYYKYPSERFVVLQGIFGRPEYLIRDPDLVRQIAVRDFSSFVDRIAGVHHGTDPMIGNQLTNLTTDDWRRMRNLLTPLLSGQKLKQIVIPSLDDNKRELIKFLGDEMQTSENELIVDMMDLSTRSGVDGFSLIAFGVKTDSLRSNGSEYDLFESSQSILEHYNSLGKATYSAMIFFPRIMKFIFGKTFMKQIDHEFFTKTCKEIADNRIANKIKRSDYTQLLQSLRDKNNTSDSMAKQSMSA